MESSADVAETAEAIPIGRRGASRARVQAKATLQTITRSVPVIIRNLSCTGAMLEGDHLPGPGKSVLLKRGSSEEMADVIWSENGRCGITFFDPLPSEEAVNQARSIPDTIKAPSVPYYWRSAMKDDQGLSVEEWEATRRALRGRH